MGLSEIQVELDVLLSQYDVLDEGFRDKLVRHKIPILAARIEVEKVHALRDIADRLAK